MSQYRYDPAFEAILPLLPTVQDFSTLEKVREARGALAELMPAGLSDRDDVSMEDVTLEQGLGEALDRLSDRERFVVERRYGLGSFQEQTLSEVASQMGVSLERVRQIQMRALGKLRTPTLRKAIDPFL